MLKYGLKRAFVALIILRARVLLEVICVLIDGVVCQMHKKIAKVATERRHILTRCKACQSLLVDEDPQRRHAGDKHVDPQIKFQSINQVRLMQVSLGNVMLIRLDPLIIASQENSFALATILWFYDECFCLSLVKLLSELFGFCWEQPGLREKLVVFGKVFLHCEKVFGQ